MILEKSKGKKCQVSKKEILMEMNNLFLYDNLYFLNKT